MTRKQKLDIYKRVIASLKELEIDNSKVDKNSAIPNLFNEVK